MKQNSKCKLIIFSDIHYLDDVPEYCDLQTSRNLGRKLIGYSIPILNQLIYKINNEYRPDVCINLGDLIEDTYNHDKDVINLKFIWDKFKEIERPFYSIIGNHDLRMMASREEVEEIMGYKHSTFSVDINGYHLVLLGTEIRNDMGLERGGIFKTQYISDEDLEWLKNDLDNNQLPCLIFTHFGIAEDEMKGNWWFGETPECAFLRNRRDIKEIIKNYNNILAVFSGHQHWTKTIEEDGIQYYVLGSLTENINNDGIPDGVYFEVDLDKEKIKVTEHHIKV